MFVENKVKIICDLVSVTIIGIFLGILVMKAINFNQEYKVEFKEFGQIQFVKKGVNQ